MQATEPVDKMTGSFGGPGQKPGQPEPRPSKQSPENNPFRQVRQIRQAAAKNDPEPGFPSPARPRPEDVPSKVTSQPSATEKEEATAIQPGVRLVAFGIDIIVCYLIALITAYLIAVVSALIPFIGGLLELQTVMGLVFLTRDFFFAGHGFGKNLMGLKVIDASTGDPPTVLQSVLRNIILIAPFVAFQIIVTILRFVPLAWLDSAVLQLCQLICTAYILIVLPMEGYRTLTRADGLRKGDELANTQIVEAAMDFSHFLPPPKA